MTESYPGDTESIVQVVRKINAAWLNGEYNLIGQHIAEDAVIAPPGFEGRVRGRESYVASYREYDEQATTLSFVPEEPAVDIIGDVAVAVCPFQVEYELTGTVHRETGHDLLVFSKENGSWVVIWRTMQTMDVTS